MRRLFAVMTAALCLVALFGCAKEKEGKEVGEVCYDFTLSDVDGKEFTLSSTRGKVVFINFWYTTCEPCIEELPAFEKVRAAHDDVEVVAVHSGYTETDVAAFLAEQETDGVKWRDWGVKFVLDSGGGEHSDVYEKLGGTGSFPRTVVLDKDGVIADVYGGAVTETWLETRVQLLTVMAE